MDQKIEVTRQYFAYTPPKGGARTITIRSYNATRKSPNTRGDESPLITHRNDRQFSEKPQNRMRLANGEILIVLRRVSPATLPRDYLYPPSSSCAERLLSNNKDVKLARVSATATLGGRFRRTTTVYYSEMKAASSSGLIYARLRTASCIIRYVNTVPAVIFTPTPHIMHLVLPQIMDTLYGYKAILGLGGTEPARAQEHIALPPLLYSKASPERCTRDKINCQNTSQANTFLTSIYYGDCNLSAQQMSHDYVYGCDCLVAMTSMEVVW
ncbi:hypothetical protein J6590_024086 [Homalodisca vitripennis]|nr:hypothetical protein J6590_024086 [Homalodisca vitripennis]